MRTWNQLINLVGLVTAIGLAPYAIGAAYFQSSPSLAASSMLAASPMAGIGSSRANEEIVWVEISLSQRKVTLYHGVNRIEEYPIGIGRAGWETPVGTFQVQQMQEHPTWIHPFTDERIPGGDSRNPLGTRWVGFWTDGHVWVGFHGTSDPASVGTAASHGCIRMHNADVEALFARIELGTPVRVVP
ncbi:MULTISPECIES: L,D-transpeptidase [Cyanophyceae]|uniref:L,D-transpeptidase n=1 Tax=Cyanophyceae TaxID=3028117 RepID=UPI00168579EC|nr:MULTISPECIES: L,D-transpeptidase [Cyanophyceae]MBD1915615.1 L,D-transpeptidase [Phormidium sp. FACHB-77]MBD2031925.1 L,D-transpeptidase [Phormidium sp. FACHB-322]MBD2050675.1 L,D-transpeptidase [Leptolyngbya sp. FACHB-60]